MLNRNFYLIEFEVIGRQTKDSYLIESETTRDLVKDGFGFDFGLVRNKSDRNIDFYLEIGWTLPN